MKKTLLALFTGLWTLTISAQPRPFDIDTSFVPSLEFMQKSWTGEYDGLEPNSKMILSIKRQLVLNSDLTYKNEVKGHIKEQSEEVLLRYETGTYQYDSENHNIRYSIEMDSTLDINLLLQGEELSYAVNHYKETETEKTSMEEVQFTVATNDASRQWVLFDQQLMSPIDPKQKAVYVMGGTEIEPTGISAIHGNIDTIERDVYTLDGRKIISPRKGLFIINGKKFIIK